jgi:hypothetical protein
MGPAAVRAVRRLDVAWGLKQYPFKDARSEVSGVFHTADEICLAALHLARVNVGSKRERRESWEWLKAHPSIRVLDAYAAWESAKGFLH